MEYPQKIKNYIKSFKKCTEKGFEARKVKRRLDHLLNSRTKKAFDKDFELFGTRARIDKKK